MNRNEFSMKIKIPWRLGYNDRELSNKGRCATKLIGAEDLLEISKYNIFLDQRDKKIRELFRRGFAQHILVELSGLSSSQVSRIVGLKEDYGQQ